MRATAFPAGLLTLTQESRGARAVHPAPRERRHPTIARQSIGRRAATAAEARALGETRGAP